ncbi:MAG: TonB-dependent receptor [Balneolaceae bacterium]
MKKVQLYIKAAFLLLIISGFTSILQWKELLAQTNENLSRNGYVFNSTQTGPFYRVSEYKDSISELQKVFTLEIKNNSIKQVLQKIAEQAPLGISINPDLPALNKRISLSIVSGTIADALTKVLETTDYEAAISRRREIVLLKKEALSPVQEVVLQTGTLAGKITDSVTGEPLVGANIMIENTSTGTATNIDGEYRLRNVEEGEQTLVVRYLGYITKNVEVEVTAGETTALDVELEPDVIEGQEVTVYSQARGQVKAIRQQLTSNTIVNVVSESRIREVADNNAAETVGRLPGVSIQRSGGEAQNVVIRGLSPRFSNITVGGTRLSSTSLNDRNTDLHMISSDMISGIELYKSIRPDMDADAVAGTVNFTIDGAPDESRTRLNFQYGYNDHTQRLGNYKGDLNFSQRFFENRLGVMGTVSIQGVDRSSDNLDASYFVPRERREDEAVAPIEVEDLRFTDRAQRRERYGASLVLDYRFEDNGRILFSNFANRMNRDEVQRQRLYNLDRTEQSYIISDTEQQVDVLSSTLSGEHNLWGAKLDWRLSRSQSVRDDPYNHRMNFLELGAFNDAELDLTKGPEVIPSAARNELDETFLMNAEFNENYSTETDLGAMFDLEVPFEVGRLIDATVKFGGKYTSKDRERISDQYYHRFDGVNQTNLIIQNLPGEHVKTQSGFYSIENFIEPGFNKNNYLDGMYIFGLGLSRDRAREFQEAINEDLGYYNRRLSAMMNNHWAREELSAGYILSEINIGSRLMILPGVRYEYDHSEYTAHVGQIGYLTDEEGNTVNDSTTTREMGHWFPMVHMRLNLLKGLDLRLAWTKSANRPNFDQVVPRERIHVEDSDVRRGITGLKPAIATNYDAFLNYYTNKFGLISVGGYYKKIDDLIYDRNVTIFRPLEIGLPEFTTGYNLREPYNNPHSTTLKGVEVEWQSNFLNMPSPLNGLMLNINYSRIWSETQYHQFQVERQPGVGIVGIDTFRVARMVLQSDHIANMTVGYDYKGFSGRVSMLYQGETLTSVGSRPENDSFTHALFRWDASFRQRIFDSGASVSLNFYNLTNEPDRSYQSSWGYATDEEYYGWSMDVGIRYDF